MVEFLLQCGFSVSSRNNEGKTPLHTASIKVVIIIIVIVIIININNEGKTAIARGGGKGCKYEEEKVLSLESDCLTPWPPFPAQPVRQTWPGLLVRLTLTSLGLNIHSSNAELGSSC